MADVCRDHCCAPESCSSLALRTVSASLSSSIHCCGMWTRTRQTGQEHEVQQNALLPHVGTEPTCYTPVDHTLTNWTVTDLLTAS